MPMPFRALSLLFLLLAGCAGTTPLTLMNTPVIYQQAAVDPFAHLPEAERVPPVAVFYASNRGRSGAAFGNAISNELHLGRASVQLGVPDDDWPDLYQASISEIRERELPLALTRVENLSQLDLATPLPTQLNAAQQAYVDAINFELAKARDKEIIIYVHGAKVDFANACELMGEIVHFAGRDFVGVAFSWPSHQNILSYLTGTDVRRARDSQAALASLIELLARHTNAERINLIAYSAGARVASLALPTLQNRHPRLNARQLKEHYRVGAVVFAAGDVPEELFEQRLSAISRLAEQVLITLSDRDDALEYARRLMAGGARIGSSRAEESLHHFTHDWHLDNVTLLDVSSHQAERGFDIAGHHYWYRHAWASSDVILLMRTNLPPWQRGLTVSDSAELWYMDRNYPDNVRNAVRRALKGQW
ncbi:alpha/beta hydrolase [Pseudomonas sp. BMS12]|uniref:alpha/beta hydrolase n=1 Tax=Pseudomonas sp. BMS12 TaxID=1796033 RepID=UPI00083A09C4|nr:alpha/beta hydrolase [Pseudomonas sp. BMS12]